MSVSCSEEEIDGFTLKACANREQLQAEIKVRPARPLSPWSVDDYPVSSDINGHTGSGVAARPRQTNVGGRKRRSVGSRQFGYAASDFVALGSDEDDEDDDERDEPPQKTDDSDGPYQRYQNRAKTKKVVKRQRPSRNADGPYEVREDTDDDDYDEYMVEDDLEGDKDSDYSHTTTTTPKLSTTSWKKTAAMRKQQLMIKQQEELLRAAAERKKMRLAQSARASLKAQVGETLRAQIVAKTSKTQPTAKAKLSAASTGRSHPPKETAPVQQGSSATSKQPYHGVALAAGMRPKVIDHLEKIRRMVHLPKKWQTCMRHVYIAMRTDNLEKKKKQEQMRTNLNAVTHMQYNPTYLKQKPTGPQQKAPQAAQQPSLPPPPPPLPPQQFIVGGQPGAGMAGTVDTAMINYVRAAGSYVPMYYPGQAPAYMPYQQFPGTYYPPGAVPSSYVNSQQSAAAAVYYQQQQQQQRSHPQQQQHQQQQQQQQRAQQAQLHHLNHPQHHMQSQQQNLLSQKQIPMPPPPTMAMPPMPPQMMDSNHPIHQQHLPLKRPRGPLGRKAEEAQKQQMRGSVPGAPGSAPVSAHAHTIAAVRSPPTATSSTGQQQDDDVICISPDDHSSTTPAPPAPVEPVKETTPVLPPVVAAAAFERSAPAVSEPSTTVTEPLESSHIPTVTAAAASAAGDEDTDNVLPPTA